MQDSTKTPFLLKKLYKVIKGIDILTLSDEKIDPIIEGILYPKDYIMIVAEEKMGKTIIAQQLSCNLTMGQPFLNIFNIPKPINVWYFITEGKEDDIKDRFIRMKNGIEIDIERLCLIPTLFRFNTPIGERVLEEIVNTNDKIRPDVLIIDSLYPAIKGSLRDEEVVNDFHFLIRWIQHELDCAVILIHHFSKRVRTPDGKVIERSDKDLFGSAFFAAAVDHVLWLDRWSYDKGEKGHDKILKCDTQRSGKIFDSVRIRLIEPDPLYFEAVDKHLEEKHRVEEILKSAKGFITSKEVMEKARVRRTVLFQIFQELKKDKILLQEGDRKTAKYWIRK